MRRLTLVISSLSSGGAERILVTMARAFIEKGHSVSVVTLFGKEADFYPLPDAAHRIALGMEGTSTTRWQAIRDNIRRLRALRAAILSTHPDAVISFIDRTNVLVLLALLGTSVPVIVSERVSMAKYSCGRIWELLRRLLYPFASLLVSISHGVDQHFSWLPPEKRAVMHNPLTESYTSAESSPPLHLPDSKKHLIAMGRLTFQKGFDLLVDSFAQISEKNPEWDLFILGEGEEREALTALISKLKMERRIFLPGRIHNPFAVLRQAHLFVMSSRFEGFGNVIVEAMACGLPVVSFDCPSGPSEIIRDQVDGVLVKPEDPKVLASAMDRLMADAQERARLGANARQVIERFGVERAIARWEELLDQVLSRR